MSAVDRAAQGWAAAQQVRQNQYVNRLISDPELRDNARVAYSHAQKAFQRIQSSKAPASALLDDQKLHAELRTAQHNLTAAITALREGPVKAKKKHRLRNLVLLSIVTAGVALVVSEGLRNKALDLLFGAEEEFDYTSTTVASPPPAAPVAPPVTVNGDSAATSTVDSETEPAAGEPEA